MDGISSRKLTWGICIAGIAIAIISFFFLPEIIPVHFAGNGVADDFGNKIEIFLMPILLLTVTILSGIKSIKYVLMHSKTWLTVGQYNLMIDCVLGIILIAEIFMIYASFAFMGEFNRQCPVIMTRTTKIIKIISVCFD